MWPHLDESKANDYVGKSILLCVSYIDHEEKQTGQMQWFGVITEVSNAKGIVIALRNNSEHCALPPDLSALRPAKPGEYRLRATGEVITDPDFITTWTCKEPEPNWKPGT
jgi:hypothetical protein